MDAVSISHGPFMGCVGQRKRWGGGSCLKTGQHFIFINLLLPIKCIIFDSVSKILFIFLLSIIMILIMKILLHNVYKIINLRYPTYVYHFFLIFLIITKCWPVFKQDPRWATVGLVEGAMAHGGSKWTSLLGTQNPL